MKNSIVSFWTVFAWYKTVFAWYKTVFAWYSFPQADRVSGVPYLDFLNWGRGKQSALEQGKYKRLNLSD